MQTFLIPFGLVAKRRSDATTVEAFNLVGEVNGRNVLLVDDMTETAGTLIAAAKLARSKGASESELWSAMVFSTRWAMSALRMEIWMS